MLDLLHEEMMLFSLVLLSQSQNTCSKLLHVHYSALHYPTLHVPYSTLPCPALHYSTLQYTARVPLYNVLAISIRQICNFSIKLPHFQKNCKLAELKPLYKKGTKIDP